MNIRLLSAFLLLPSLAHAHPGHGGAGFSGGFVHPLAGWDHLLAMLAVGLWAAQLGGVARWALPAAFVGAMSLSLGIGIAGFSLPWTEACIAISLLILGAVIAARVRVLPMVAVALVAGCAFFHGLAHAPEAPAAGGASYIAGLILSTILLHVGGVSAGTLLISTGRGRWLQAAGTAVCGAGIWCGLV